MTGELVRTLERWFYWLGAVAIIAVVALGFSFTIERNLLHPSAPRPPILYVHAVVFTAWVLLLFVQSTLIRATQTKIHRRLGEFGIVLGGALPVIGAWTAVAMARYHLQQGRPDALSFLIVPLGDMLLFSVFFGSAVLMRTRPEAHRRLMFIASCALTGAAFGRLPPSFIPQPWYYAGVEALVLLGAIRDLVASRRVHPAYACALPVLAAVHLLTLGTGIAASPWWMSIARRLVA